MSLSKNKKSQIKEYILDKIGDNDDVVDKVQKCFEISAATVYRYLDELIKDGAIKRKKRGKYVLLEKQYNFSYENVGLEEDVIFAKDIRPILLEQNLPTNVMNIWYYAFTEMFNNAIEHSESKRIQCSLFVSRSNINMLIRDQGIGIFKKIKEYYNYETLDDVISELFKGKLTTDSKNHTGEGIFFTSRLMDIFVVVSSKKYFTHDNYKEIVSTLDEDDELNQLMNNEGTVVWMRLANRSHKQIKEVFDMFSDGNNGFNKTSIPMKNVFGNNFPVSRSQARRLYNRFDRFDEVELDFRGVDEIGQAFAHELFVKFASLKPDIKIKVVNAGKEVENMINRVKNTK